MKITVVREEFLKAFELAAMVAPSRATKAIMQNIKVQVLPHGVKLYATDADVSIVVDHACDRIDKPGTVLLDAGRAKSILRECSDQHVTLELDDNVVLLTSSSSRFKLPTANADEFPSIGHVDLPEDQMTLSREALSAAIKATSFAVDSESTRYALGGVLFERCDDDTALLVATDGRRLVKAVARISDKQANWQGGVIVPAAALKVIERIASGETVTLHSTNNEIYCVGNGVLLRATLIEGRFPNWRQVVPSGYTDQVVMPIGILSSLIRQAAITADPESRGVDFVFEDGQLTVSSITADVGEARLTMPVAFVGKLHTRLDSRYLLEFLRQFEASAQLTFRMKDGRSSVVLEAGTALIVCEYVVMPMAIE